MTTVIILVSSVVLGSGVILYGTSLFQGNTQQESITVAKLRVWVHSSDNEGLSWGAAKIRNTGDTVISLDKIAIRGTEIPFSQWYADTTVIGTTFQQNLNHSGWQTSGSGGLMVQDATCAGIPSTLRIDLTGEDTVDSSICANAGNGPTDYLLENK